MLLQNIQCLAWGGLLFILLTMGCARYAYQVNARRADNDPQKRDFHPLAILFAPITLPLYAIVGIATFLLTALLFGIALILFAAMLIFVREPIIFRWFGKKALSFGNRLLELNTALVRLFWNPRVTQPETQKSPYPYKLEFLFRRFA
jgi:small neutral amino acid transporter SnatA (MarC family)